MRRWVKAGLVGAVLLLNPLTPHVIAKSPSASDKGHRAAVRYYITAKTMLITEDTVSVFGASNLPAGSVLILYVYDYIGEGSRIFNEETRVAVGNDGLFETAIHPKGSLKFRTNMVCDVVFGPDYPGQPKNVIEIIGHAGERLGSAATNPQVYGNSRVTGLADLTIVTQ